MYAQQLVYKTLEEKWFSSYKVFMQNSEEASKLIHSTLDDGDNPIVMSTHYRQVYT